METYCIPIKHVNCYLVKINDFYIAIDSGWPGCIREYREALKTHNIKPEKIKYLFVTHFHPDDSISVVFQDGTAFIGDLYSPDLVMEDDDKSKQSWNSLKLKGSKAIYPAHGNSYILDM